MRNEPTGEMPLGAALQILCDVHTRDNPEIGFELMMGATYEPHAHWFAPEEYLRAWEAVRRSAGLRTEKQKTPNEAA